MRCRNCGRKLPDGAAVCSLCGAEIQQRIRPQSEVQRTVRVKRVAAPAQPPVRKMPDTQAITLIEERRQRRGDVLYGMLVAFLVLLALVSAALCVLLLTRGPDTEQWFQKDAPTAQAMESAHLPTPIPTASATQPLPTAEPTATPMPSFTPSPAPTATPAPPPAPTSAAEGKAALEALLLEGIERQYTKQELKDLTKDELSILRNGMYAYSGLSFKKELYKNFFGDCDWYEPSASDDEKVYKRFNANQKKNVATILSIEKEKGYR